MIYKESRSITCPEGLPRTLKGITPDTIALTTTDETTVASFKLVGLLLDLLMKKTDDPSSFHCPDCPLPTTETCATNINELYLDFVHRPTSTLKYQQTAFNQLKIISTATDIPHIDPEYLKTIQL